jgi:hypothetical protein
MGKCLVYGCHWEDGPERSAMSIIHDTRIGVPRKIVHCGWLSTISGNKNRIVVQKCYLGFGVPYFQRTSLDVLEAIAAEMSTSSKSWMTMT